VPININATLPIHNPHLSLPTSSPTAPNDMHRHPTAPNGTQRHPTAPNGSQDTKLAFRPACSWADAKSSIETLSTKMLYFCGHGGSDAATNSSIVFQDERGLYQVRCVLRGASTSVFHVCFTCVSRVCMRVFHVCMRVLCFLCVRRSRIDPYSHRLLICASCRRWRSRHL
jgi:hypothetical protein